MKQLINKLFNAIGTPLPFVVGVLLAATIFVPAADLTLYFSWRLMDWIIPGYEIPDGAIYASGAISAYLIIMATLLVAFLHFKVASWMFRNEWHIGPWGKPETPRSKWVKSLVYRNADGREIFGIGFAFDRMLRIYKINWDLPYAGFLFLGFGVEWATSTRFHRIITAKPRIWCHVSPMHFKGVRLIKSDLGVNIWINRFCLSVELG